MDINEWLAEQCGIELKQTWQGQAWSAGEGFYAYPFDYKNPQCTSIIEEHFKIATDCFDSCWRAFPRQSIEMTIKCLSEGETPHIARCKCIEAIYATEDR